MIFHQTRRTCWFVAFFLFVPVLLSNFATFDAKGDETLAARPTESRLREFRGRTMGTTYMVKLYGLDQIDDDTLRIKLDSELRHVNDEMSTYLKSSEITHFNQSDSTDWFSVSENFATVVRAAQEISRLTDGAFDITVGPLINAWSFGAAERTMTPPDQITIAKLLERTGYEKLSVRLDPPALRKDISNLQIDLSAIAKGHGVDRLVDLLISLGAGDMFVEVGGEVRTVGQKPQGSWTVGIQLPDAKSNMIMLAHTMVRGHPAGTSMATSGDYRNFYEVDGQKYSHTIDPRSGSPVRHGLASASVVTPNCMQADGWATALNVLGPKRGLELAEQNKLNVLLVSRTKSEKYDMVGTGILAQYAQTAVDTTPASGEGLTFSAVLPIAILTFCVLSVLLMAMAIGVIFGRKSISGSCGGLANKTNEDGSTSCALCSSPSDACKELRDKMAESTKQTATEG